MYYALVIIATIFFSLQFFCQQRYEEDCGTELKDALGFSLYKGVVVAVMMLILGKFKIQFSWFSVVISGVYALSYILMIYFSLKALSVANLSVFSVFAMLGGMMLPFLVGVMFYNEGITTFKIICCLLVALSVLLTVRGGKSQRKALVYYLLVFVINGMVGVFSKIHQDSALPHVDSTSFMFYSGIFTIVICGLWLVFTGNKVPLFKGKRLLYSAGDGILNGVGDLLLLIALVKLPASVQYPLVTGGVMVCSTLISTIRREDVKKLDYIAAVIALGASIMIAF